MEEAETGNWSTDLDSSDPEALLGVDGLKASRWRARRAAAQLLAQPFATRWVSSQVQGQIDLYERVLRQLLLVLALEDPNWQVRVAAVESGTTILIALERFLSASIFSEFAVGLLASYVDPQNEVKEAASRSLLQELQPSSVQVAVSSLADRFIGAVVRHGDLQAKSSTRARLEFTGLDNVPLGDSLLAGITAAICLELFPLPGWKSESSREHEVDIVPLLVVLVSRALEENRVKNRVLAKGFVKFLRCVGYGCYRQSLLGMLSPGSPYYLPDMHLLKTYSTKELVDEDTVEALKAVELKCCFGALATALDPLEDDELQTHSEIRKDKPLSGSSPDSGISEDEFIVLQHVLEMIHVPSVLTHVVKEEKEKVELHKFLELSAPLLRIVKNILENKRCTLWNCKSRAKFVEELILCSGTFAHDDAEDVGPLLWTTEEHSKLALSSITLLGKSWLANQPEGSVSESKHLHSDMQIICFVVSQNVATIIPPLKDIIKGNPESGGTNTSYANGISEVSVVAAHQMSWCIRQLDRCYLEQHVSLLMPAVLTAMDHFSPEVKRRGMRSLLHLARTLNPREFSWNEDVILDVVSRSLVGWSELWAIGVKLAVKAVTSCEGSNNRSRWYRQIFSGTLEEMARNRDDQVRRLIWLQEITPQMEAMGLVMVAHFTMLLPLLYYWLHARDDSTCLLALARLRTVILYTWPRIPAHTKRLTTEVALTYHESSDRKLAVEVQTAAVDVLQLLNLCGGKQVAEALEENDERKYSKVKQPEFH